MANTLSPINFARPSSSSPPPLTNEQFSFEQDFSLRRAGLLDGLDQQPGGHRADFAHRLPDRGERRFAIFSHWDIVVADNRYIFRHPPPSLAQRPQRPDRHLIVMG